MAKSEDLRDRFAHLRMIASCQQQLRISDHALISLLLLAPRRPLAERSSLMDAHAGDGGTRVAMGLTQTLIFEARVIAQIVEERACPISRVYWDS